MKLWLVAGVGFAIFAGGSATAAVPAFDREQNARVFDFVWDAVRANFFDLAAVGTNWSRARDRFRPAAIAAADEGSLYQALNGMLMTLNEGHTIAAPPSYMVRMRSDSTPPALGVDLALRADGWNVTDVVSGQPGDLAGLKIGSVILEVDGLVFDGFFQPRTGTTMSLKVRDPDGVVGTRTLTPVQSSPSTDRVARDLSGGVLYLHFLTFRDGTSDWIARQIAARSNVAAVILDLRGNEGGGLAEGVRILSQFVESPLPLGRMSSRVRTHEEGCNRAMLTRGGDQIFAGPLAVLIDRYSFSDAEFVASVLQSSHRAQIVGEPSGGEVACSVTRSLPDGGALRISVASYVTKEQRSLAHVGVIPEHQVPIGPDARRSVDDPALMEALRQLAAIRSIRSKPSS